MELKKRIQKLSKIVSSHSIKAINKLYKEEEVNYVMNHLKKYPHVKYSEQMLKRTIREAKAKRISPGRCKYVQFLIDKNNEFDFEKYRSLINTQVDQFIETLNEQIKEPNLVSLIHIEHDYEADDNYCHVYGEKHKTNQDNELAFFDTKFDFKALWGFNQDKKYNDVCEELETIEIDDETYIFCFEELFKLRSYQLVEMALNREGIPAFIKNECKIHNACIEIGEHDCEFYKVFEC